MAKIEGSAGKDFIHRFRDGNTAPAGYVDVEGVTTRSDTLSGFAGNDIMFADAGNDLLDGGAGADTMTGGAGNDTYIVDNKADKVVEEASDGTDTVESSVTFSLGANIENLTLTGSTAINGTGNALANKLIGNAADNKLDGGAGTDSLEGGNGNDTLIGGAGADVLKGGLGSDYASYETAAATVTASLANPAANTGDALGDIYDSIEHLQGSNFNDTLIGNGGNNILRGGGGADTLDGGAGSDTASYSTAKAGITASLADPKSNKGEAKGDTYISIENLAGSSFDDTLKGNEGSNTLQGYGGADLLDGAGGFDYASYSGALSGVTASLASPGSNAGEAAGDTYISIEALRGSSFDDVLAGNGASNWLEGRGGADKLDGGANFDYASYSNASTGVTASLANPGINTGEAAGDTYVAIEGLVGSAFDDVLVGDSGSNYLRGLAGADTLNGGLGSDGASYADATAGVTASLANPGINTGDAAGDKYISIERLVGSLFDDVLIGDANNNLLFGGRGGADKFDGGGGFDAVVYHDEASGVTASLADSSVNKGAALGATYVSIEGLSGSDFNDVLYGDANANVLNGNAGADKLDGGAGFDYAVYNDATAGVTASLASDGANTGEAAGDTFVSIEGLGGTAFADTLIGNALGNALDGGGGNDRLVGGGGFDLLMGGTGSDTFVFNTALVAGNVSTISDFQLAGDIIELSRSIFAAAGPAGTLAAAAFYDGTGAHDASDRIIYNSTTGKLMYDADGTGGGAAVNFATLAPGLALSERSFQLV